MFQYRGGVALLMDDAIMQLGIIHGIVHIADGSVIISA